VIDPSKPRGKELTKGELASVRAATRVKPEQAPKAVSRAPSRLLTGEGRRDGSEQPTEEDPSALRGNGRSTHTGSDVQHGRPSAVPAGNRLVRNGPWKESEEPIVPMKSGNADGGKGLWFEARLDETRVGRSA
jgi:hypothetical protein